MEPSGPSPNVNSTRPSSSKFYVKPQANADVSDRSSAKNKLNHKLIVKMCQFDPFVE